MMNSRKEMDELARSSRPFSLPSRRSSSRSSSQARRMYSASEAISVSESSMTPSSLSPSSALALKVSRSMSWISERSSWPEPSTSFFLKNSDAISAVSEKRAHSSSRFTSSWMNCLKSLDLTPRPFMATKSTICFATPKNTKPETMVVMKSWKLNAATTPFAVTTTLMPYTYMSSNAPLGMPAAFMGEVQSLGRDLYLTSCPREVHASLDSISTMA